MLLDGDWRPHVIEVNGLPSLKPAEAATEAGETYNALKREVTADTARLLGAQAQDAGERDSVVSAVWEQLKQHAVGLGKDLGSAEKSGRSRCEAGWGPNAGGRWDYCLGAAELRYLLDSERERRHLGAPHCM
eukprot:SAG25_NODE_1237_length_3527_cov_9.218147_1_plen_132_part_00